MTFSWLTPETGLLAFVTAYVYALAVYAERSRRRHARRWSRPRPLHLLRVGRHTTRYVTRHTARHAQPALAAGTRSLSALPEARTV